MINKDFKLPMVKLSNGEEVDLIFSLSQDDHTNKIKGGKLLINLGMPYYADTILEDYNKWLGWEKLCIDGASDLCVLNMSEIVDFTLKNRGDIETKLRGFNFDDEMPKELSNKTLTNKGQSCEVINMGEEKELKRLYEKTNGQDRNLFIEQMLYFRMVMCSTAYDVEYKEKAFKNLVEVYFRCSLTEGDIELFVALVEEFEMRIGYEIFKNIKEKRLK